MAYYYSKVLAEKKAWEIVNSNNPSWKLVVTNPSLVLGPELHDRKSCCDSNNAIKDMMNGIVKAKVNLQLPIVDIRDTVSGHIYLMENSKCEGRNILFNKSWSISEVVEYLGM